MRAMMTLLATFYGAILINWGDLFITRQMPAATLWLTLMCLWPYLPLLFFRGLQDWQLTVALGLYTSLLNDLLYDPVAHYIFGLTRDLQNYYIWQLGFKGLTFYWNADLGLFSLPITSLTMGLSIYARLAAMLYLFKKSPRPPQGQNPQDPRR